MFLTAIALDCKRVGYDSGWLASFRRENVDLVSSPLVRISENGIETADGQSYPVEIIVWATGFAVTDSGVGLNHGVYGEDGIELSEKFKSSGGAYGYLGVAMPDVPNCFAVLGPNAIAMSWGYTLGNNVSSLSHSSPTLPPVCPLLFWRTSDTDDDLYNRLSLSQGSSKDYTIESFHRSSSNTKLSKSTTDTFNTESRIRSGTLQNAVEAGTSTLPQERSRFLLLSVRVSFASLCFLLFRFGDDSHSRRNHLTGLISYIERFNLLQ